MILSLFKFWRKKHGPNSKNIILNLLYEILQTLRHAFLQFIIKINFPFLPLKISSYFFGTEFLLKSAIRKCSLLYLITKKILKRPISYLVFTLQGQKCKVSSNILFITLNINYQHLNIRRLTSYYTNQYGF